MNIAIIVILASLSQAADAPKLDEKQLVQILEPHFQTQAAKYEFFLDEARQQKLELVEKPVMRWTADGPRWHYSPVRFTWREVWLTHGDQELWRVPESNEFWKSQTLRDNYVTCALGLLDVDAIRSAQKKTP